MKKSLYIILSLITVFVFAHYTYTRFKYHVARGLMENYAVTMRQVYDSAMKSDEGTKRRECAEYINYYYPMPWNDGVHEALLETYRKTLVDRILNSITQIDSSHGNDQGKTTTNE